MIGLYLIFACWQPTIVTKAIVFMLELGVWKSAIIC